MTKLQMADEKRKKQDIFRSWQNDRDVAGRERDKKTFSEVREKADEKRIAVFAKRKKAWKYEAGLYK